MQSIVDKLTEKYVDNLDYAWMGLEREDLKDFENPMLHRSKKDLERPDLFLLRIMRQPKYFWITCKYLLNIELYPEQLVVLQELWDKPFPMFVAARGAGKSWLLAVYAILRCLFVPGTKVVIAGAGFRHAKVIFGYMEAIWANAPVLRSICYAHTKNIKRVGPKIDVDRCTFYICDSTATAVPVGDGSKIRGLRATVVIADEFDAHNPAIFETVIQGFASVTGDPMANVKLLAKQAKLKAKGIWSPELEKIYEGAIKGNQLIMSGTAGYAFNHFAKNWEKYARAINSKGDPRIMQEMFGDEEFDHRDFVIIRLPYDLVPPGFMDSKVIARARATIHMGIFQMEYGAVFTSDSEGFFKRSLIESCVASDAHPIELPSGAVWFDARTRGDMSKKYVIGVDPAAESDNFSIMVLELHPDHTRIVYAWSTNRKDFQKKVAAGLASKLDYYGFCVRKIRDLMKIFPVVAIGLDSQGGGVSIIEGLHDPDKMEEGEQFIWPKIDPDKPQPTDEKAGLHILEVINFADAKWTAEANHGMRTDMEHKVLLFPRFDPITIDLAVQEDKAVFDAMRKKDKNITPDNYRMYDTLEDCVLEIEELKNELATIILTRTGNNERDRWDTPETKLPDGKKGKLLKDRYSALVIANMIARQIARAEAAPIYSMIGGAVGYIERKDGRMYDGEAWDVDPSIYIRLR